ncbi:MAG TPA: ABC transporter permease [Candidatus Fusicatenibacter merdavium]|uniref:ABC transporter permease n=1 Tax=Candidatus Fusicatenibacter merdavium TaxID=2838600 RepID=A0A9D1XE13_9FIRM|nr:ABC transporter permease [Candidatus Fusicatenibacter merdavium]
MFKLIQNEMIKIFSKVSTYIMLGILLVLLVGVSALMKISGTYSYSGYTYTEQDLQSELDYLNSSKPDGYEVQVAEYEYMMKSGREWNTDSWEFEALDEAFQNFQAPLSYQRDGMTDEEAAAYQNNLDETIRVIESGDWNAYAQLRLDQIAAGTEEETVKEARSFPYRYMLDNQIKADAGDWREDAAMEAGTAKLQVAELDQQKAQGMYVSEESYEEAQNQAAICEYRLEHGIENYIDEDGMTGSEYWNSFLQESMMITVVSVIMIVLAGGCVANEFANGTVKFLLVNPVTRRKIIVSKYLTMLLLSLLMILGVYVLAALINLPFFGADFGVPYLTAANGEVTAGSGYLYALKDYLLEGVSLVAMTTMAFMISSMMRNSALAIGIGVTALLGGSMVVAMLAQLGCDWGRYFLFANMNLSQAASGNTVFPNQSLGFSLGVLAVHMVIFLITAYDGFTRREV